MHLMMLAFLIDQIQQRCCRLSKPPERPLGTRPGCGASSATASICVWSPTGRRSIAPLSIRYGCPCRMTPP